MKESIWGVEIALKEGEKVIIDSAEVVGTVVGVGVSKIYNKPIYCVKFPKGSVYSNDAGYVYDAIWFNPRQLRNINTGAYVG